MLRNFHYIDDKGKDQGINGELGTSILSYMLMFDALFQFGSGQRKSSTSSLILRKCGKNDGKPKRIATNILVPETIL